MKDEEKALNFFKKTLMKSSWRLFVCKGGEELLSHNKTARVCVLKTTQYEGATKNTRRKEKERKNSTC